MKARQVLIFLVSVFALLGVLAFFMPADGVAAGPLTIRFASLQRTIRDAGEVKVDVDSVLTALEQSFGRKDFQKPEHLFLPEEDFFNPVFDAFQEDTLTRVVHYGDSQIELDRISQDLRQDLQERFGGSGTGFFPALSNVPSASISKVASGAFMQYTMYGDSTTMRAGHNRYGILAQVVQLTGGGTVTLRSTPNKNARERVQSFETVTVLYGRPANGFSVKAVSDTLKPQGITEVGESGLRKVTWHFGKPVQKAVLTFKGDAEIYAISADPETGVQVDNVPLRGCSGTIFHRISKPLMADSFGLTNTRLIILQFGGNYMPVAKSTRVIEQYQEQIEKEIQYFHEVAPLARILFIGPSDMGKSVGGKIVTWPRLPEMVDSLKATALRNDAAYWDLFRMMGGENSMGQWVKHNPPYAGPDYIHFTPAGAQKVGDALSNSILTYYQHYHQTK